MGTVSIGRPASEDIVGVSATGSVGSVTIPTDGDDTVSVTGVNGTGSLGTVAVNTTSPTTYTVTVQSYGGGNRYYVDGVRQPTLSFLRAVHMCLTGRRLQVIRYAFLPLRMAHMAAVRNTQQA